MKVDLKLKGAKELGIALHEVSTLKGVKKVLKYHTSQLDQAMKRRAVFTRGYSVGDTRRSIRMEIDSDGLTGRVKPGTHYAGYLETGTRYMSAQPFAQPALNEVEGPFLEDLKKASKLKK